MGEAEVLPAEEELWAANPWQAQADAQLWQLTQAGVAPLSPLVPGPPSPYLQHTSLPPSPGYGHFPPPAEAGAAVLPPLLLPDGCSDGAPLLAVAAPARPAAAAPAAGVGEAAATEPMQQVTMLPPPAPQHAVTAEAFVQDGLLWPSGGTKALAAAKGSEGHGDSELQARIATLEGRLAARERELAEARAAAARAKAPGAKGSSADAAELQRQVAFLTTLVSRFERKVMDLEQELETVAVAKRDAEERAQPCRVAVPLAAVSGDVTTESGNSLPLACPTAQRLQARVVELEGSLALAEDAAARRVAELHEELRALRVPQTPPAAASAVPGGPEPLAQEEEGTEAAAAEAEQLREQNGFLSSLVARFEEKTMDLEGRLAAASSAKELAEARARRATLRRDEVQAAKGETSALREALQEAQARASQLQEAAMQAAELVDEQRQAAESAWVALRDSRRDHNQRTQELLRRTQVLEKQKRDLEVEKHQRELEAERQGLESAAATAATEAPPAHADELKELRALNAQFMERLAAERAEHTEAQRRVADAAVENTMLSERLEQLGCQLCTIADQNDRLEAELDEFRRRRQRLEQRRAEAAEAARAERLDAMS